MKEICWLIETIYFCCAENLTSFATYSNEGPGHGSGHSFLKLSYVGLLTMWTFVDKKLLEITTQKLEWF